MAKAPQRTKMELRGVSQDALTEAREKFDSMAQVIELPIRGGKTARFELVVISAGDIQQQTYVAGENARIQEMLNPVAVSDIAPSIKAHGQQYPAIGQRNDNTDGKIKVMDGSRRRFTCYTNGKDFYVYVTADNISPADIRYLSNTANVSKPLSLYEKGSMFDDLLATGEYADAKALAVGEEEHESTVSIALNIYRQIPKYVANYIPSISDLGRGLSKQLTDMFTDVRLTAEQRNKLELAASKSDNSTEKLSEQLKTKDPARLNSAFVDSMRQQYLQLLPKAPTKAPAPILASKGNTKAVITKTTRRGFSVQIDCTDEKTRAAIETAIQKAIEGGK